MKKSLREEQCSRRAFLSRSACSAMGLTGVVSTLTSMRLMQESLIAQQSSYGDYKALVVLFLFGGANTDNMLIPRGPHSSRPDYYTGRGVLGIPNDILRNNPASSDTNQFSSAINAFNIKEASGVLHADARYYLNPALARRGDGTAGSCVKDIYNANNLAFVTNVGTMVEPVTKSGNLQFSGIVPPQLFSHSDQQVQWQSALSDQPFRSGWAGRVADLMHSGNDPSNVSMSVTLSGLNSLLVGTPGVGAQQYSVSPGGAVSLAGYKNSAGPYGQALTASGGYKTGASGRRLRAFETIMNHTHANLMEEQYNRVVRSARDNEQVVTDALNAIGPGSQGNGLSVELDNVFFDQHELTGTSRKVSSLPKVAQQLLMTTKLIAGKSQLGNERQLFFCSQGGYDTHQTQGGYENGVHTPGAFDSLMADLNNALAAFDRAMHLLDASPNSDVTHESVTLATHSDFNRTFNPNGEDPGAAGSDHAWGGHHIVMGGAVKGRRVYGYYPDHVIGGNWDVNDATNGARGRWIPTTSVEQFSAPLARWMGVTGTGYEAGGSSMATVFPNLHRFNDPFVTMQNGGYDPGNPLNSANLNFMD